MRHQPTTTRRRGWGTALVLFSTLCLSIEAIAAKLAYQGGANVLTTLTLRYLLAAIIFWAIILVKGYRCRLTRRNLLTVIGLALGTQTVTLLALFEAYRYLPAAVAILLLYLYPAITTILSFFLLHEPLTKPKVLALLFTLAGCALILGHPLNGLNPLGVALALVSALAYALFVVGSGRMLKEIPTTVYNTYISTVVALAIAALAVADGQLSFSFNLQALLAIVALAIFSTVLAMAAFLRGVKEIGASRSAIISTFEPAATAILAFFILKEGLTIGQITGGIIILVGILWQHRD